jgi:FolB domain-containing protein
MRNLDKVFISDLRIQGILGVYEQERNQAREILLNITLYTDMRRAARSDHIRDCVDYEQITQEIRALVEGAKRFTVEALAEDIARLCLSKPGVRQVSIKVEKPRAVLGADSVGVEIIRKKGLNLKR